MNKALLFSNSELAKDALISILGDLIKEIEIASEVNLSDKLSDPSHKDLLILHVNSLNEAAINFIGTIKTQQASTKIITIIECDKEYVDAAPFLIGLGVNGLLSGKDCKNHLIEAIKNVFDGDLYFSNTAKNLALKSISNAHNRNTKMTKRERQIVKEFKSGESSKEIAYKLGISEVTVNVHRANIKRKFNLHSPKEFFKFVKNVDSFRHN